MEIIEVGATVYKGILDQNTYVLIKNDGAVIIDAGSELVDVKKAVQGKKVLAVLITHCHFDHIWCIEDYIKEWDMPVYISQGAEEKFLDADKNCSNILRNRTMFNVKKENIRYFEDKLKIGDFDISVQFSFCEHFSSLYVQLENVWESFFLYIKYFPSVVTENVEHLFKRYTYENCS